MELLPSLWLPILLAAVATFFGGMIAWTVLPHHHKDMRPLPDEDGLVRALKELKISPGRYSFPHCGDRARQKDPEFIQKWKEGPSGELNIWRPMSMAKNLALTFLVCLGIALLVGYIGAVALERGAGFGPVMQVTATAGILGHAFGHLPSAIWFQHGPRAALFTLADGVANGLITGLIFALLWPGG